MGVHKSGTRGPRPHDRPAPEWLVSERLVDYPAAVAAMEARVAAIRGDTAPELVWLLEHPSLYTAGTSAKPSDRLTAGRLPVHRSGRGGQYTYHGPGQRVAYVMLDLSQRNHDVRRFVHELEEWVIRTLARFGVHGERRPGRVGVWVDRRHEGDAARREDKIAAVGVRVRHWITYHGVCINLDPALEHYAGIVPCGIDEPGLGVTSLAELGHGVTMAELDAALQATFAEVFGGS